MTTAGTISTAVTGDDGRYELAVDDPVDGYTATIIGYVAGDLLRACNVGSIDAPVHVLAGSPDCDPSEFSPTFESEFGG